jgi:hypothetical protein
VCYITSFRFKYVAGNASSYAYLNNERPTADLNGFAVPKSPPRHYNTWKYVALDNHTHDTGAWPARRTDALGQHDTLGQCAQI